ncbi:glycoside hydrolase family 10 protein [Haploplasma axanthum]|nr:family 10 glycosylhydrolase [Haploplasma axanthum]
MKLFYYKKPTEPINYFDSNEQVIIPEKYHEKKVRAFWVSNVVNIDFPVLKDYKEYKDKINEMFKIAKEFNINTIFYQVRPMNDAFYESKLNPYSRYLTGEEGLKPSFDVFEYIIKKAKEHKIAIHAWCNPYRVSMKLDINKNEYLKTLDDLNFAKKNPNLVITDSNNQLILNPAREEVKKFIIESMLEIIDKYDVDGIHFDDYFYPYSSLSAHDNDLNDYEEAKNDYSTIADFRRYHISDIIRRLNEKIKKRDKNIMFGISPFGIWRSKQNDERGSNTAANTSQSYDTQYADSYNWIKNGYIDYIVPQLYWEFGHPVAPYADLVDWWTNIIKDTKVKLYIGHALYRLGNEGEFENPIEIVNQIKYANKYKEVNGNVFFTYHTFKEIENKKGVLEVKKLLKGE